MIRILKLSLIILLTILFSFSVNAQETEKIIKINITGNEKIDTGFIMNNIKTKENEPYNLDKIREDMKSIYKTGFFNDVQIDVQDAEEGKIVTFVVIERLPIKAIFLSGNKKIKTEDLKDKLKVKTGSVLNFEKIKESMDEIKKHYASKGYYAARVSYEIDSESDYEVTIKLIIEEPEKAFVKKIAFTGNKIFKGSTLKDYMRTKEKGILSWFTGSGILDEDLLEEDRKNIEAFYSDNGYVRTKVGTPAIKLSDNKKTIEITLPVEEGNMYRIGSIDFAGDVMLGKDELLKRLKTKPGDVFRASLFHKDILMLTDIYQDKGYAFCDISPMTTIDDDTQKVNTVFNITKGNEIFFNRISILGNTKSRDKVIRRELRFAEGDRFSVTNINRSKKRLKNTTFFKDTDFKILKTDEPDKVNLDIAVEERPTGTLSFGVGYSTYDRVILSGNIAQENFLGTGRRVGLSASLGAFTQEFQLSYLEPYIFDLNLNAGLGLFNYKRIMDTYDYKKQGGSVSLIRPFTDDIKGSIKYRVENTDVTNIDASATTYIMQQAGTALTSSMTFALTKNTIDDILNPHVGVHSEASLEIAGGPFGGDNFFYRAIVFYGQYIPAGFWDSEFFIKGTVGTIRSYGGKRVPVYENFFVGGIDTIRGFKYGEAGPKDTDDESIGSRNQIYFNTEWIFPIYKPVGLKGVIFYDAGAGFDDSKGFMLKDYMKASAGFGIRWFSPMGPIRLEIGFNLFPKSGEKGSVFDFTMGTQY
ncbi:MAG: outer membrane protein assembly factor BamA [Proteobacteria bacterium]|nr:outer membrane protein assembly factor BamA [Pseudomonadota bacterium]